ncbi:MAG: DUF975 family protein, partial [Kiritimatiellia bacterium]|jgi:uncharacterized membrane protein|nr:DUF975 family protein [Kiritimatiellia bacterium]
VEELEILRLTREGTLGPDDLVWNSSLGKDWAPASQFFFFHSLAPSPSTSSDPSRPTGLISNALLMRQARFALRGRWAIAIGATLLYGVITQGLNFISDVGPASWKVVGFILNLLAAILISAPMALGWARFFLQIGRRQTPDLKRLFDGFKLFGKTIGTSILVGLFLSLALLPTIFVGILGAVAVGALQNHPFLPLAIVLVILLLLTSLVPIILVILNYSQAFFILSDNPRFSPSTALSHSRAIMRGFRWKYFCLGWRFFGWMLLGILTCGIGLLWVSPYMVTSQALFYDDIRIPTEATS